MGMIKETVKTSTVVIWIMLLIPSIVWSKTIHVPTDSATIQTGIDGAVHGDTVLVADGIYTGKGNKNIDFLGKAIVVRSENGPDSCIIDCEGYGRGFYMHRGEHPESQVKGFTIKRGGVFGHGGGIYCIDSSPTISECIISGNEACWVEGDFGTVMGGALYCKGVNIRNCIISENVAWFLGLWGRGQGGGIDCDSSTVSNCIIFGNSALWGGGVHCRSSQFINCTILSNFGSSEEVLVGSPSSFINCIIWDTEFGPIYGDATITYSNIPGGWPGEGNIDIDPLFRDTENDDFHLMAVDCGDPYDSPCIDAGDPGILDDSLDCWHGLGTSRSDMGAYGGANAGWPTAVEEEESEVGIVPKDFMLFQNYPNPFNSETMLRFQLSTNDFVKLIIYNILGQKLKVLFEEYQQANEHSIVWDASGFPSGIYFARLEVEGHSKTIKMVLLK